MPPPSPGSGFGQGRERIRRRLGVAVGPPHPPLQPGHQVVGGDRAGMLVVELDGQLGDVHLAAGIEVDDLARLVAPRSHAPASDRVRPRRAAAAGSSRAPAGRRSAPGACAPASPPPRPRAAGWGRRRRCRRPGRTPGAADRAGSGRGSRPSSRGPPRRPSRRSTIRAMGRRSDPRSGAGPDTGLLAPAEPENALDAALALQDLVAEHPRQALDEARELLGRPRIGPEAAAIAHRTAARALRALDQPSDAAREARQAVRLASPRRAGRAGGRGAGHALARPVPVRPRPGRARRDRAGGAAGVRRDRAAGLRPARHPARAARPARGGAGPLRHGAGRAASRP